jgi:hypothetical protein
MPDPFVEDAYAFLRANTAADFRFDEHLRPVKYVIAQDGALIAPAMVAMLKAVDTVLFIPEYADGAMEVQVTLEQLDEGTSAGGALADRWRIYHGEPEDVRWATMHMDMARYHDLVIDGEALMRPNPLGPHEARICRHMNQDHADDLRAICAAGGLNVENPIMVGIDPLGIDVRRQFDVIRVTAPETMNTPDDARRVLMRMADRP